MEPCQRYGREIKYEDFVRCPLINRIRRSREKVGCVTWQARDGSERSKKFMDARLTQLLGDGGHFRTQKGYIIDHNSPLNLPVKGVNVGWADTQDD